MQKKVYFITLLLPYIGIVTDNDDKYIWVYNINFIYTL
jgi:hypothetical protein